MWLYFLDPKNQLAIQLTGSICCPIRLYYYLISIKKSPWAMNLFYGWERCLGFLSALIGLVCLICYRLSTDVPRCCIDHLNGAPFMKFIILKMAIIPPCTTNDVCLATSTSWVISLLVVLCCYTISFLNSLQILIVVQRITKVTIRIILRILSHGSYHFSV